MNLTLHKYILKKISLVLTNIKMNVFFNLFISVSLAPHMDFSSYVHQYYKSGYLVYQVKITNS